MTQTEKFNNLASKIAHDLNVADQVITRLSAEKIITIFGSARIPEGNPKFEKVRQLACELSKLKYTVCTGGGPGIMLAGSMGGKDGGSKTLGLSIVLPHEQKSNDCLDENITFQNFAQRKIVFSAVSNAYIAAPGGFGTLDELFEVATLMQCKVIPVAPIVLFDKDFWQPLMDFIKNSLLPEKTIKQEDYDHLFITDSIEETIDHISNGLGQNGLSG